MQERLHSIHRTPLERWRVSELALRQRAGVAGAWQHMAESALDEAKLNGANRVESGAVRVAVVDVDGAECTRRRAGSALSMQVGERHRLHAGVGIAKTIGDELQTH